MPCGEPPLFHRHRCQAREPDHVTYRKDVPLPGPILSIDADTPAAVGVEARCLQVEMLDVAGPAHGVEQRITRDPLLALERGDDRPVRRVHPFHLFAQPQGDAMVPEVIAERLDDLLVRELQQPRPFLDQDHADAERREHAGVLHADDTAAHHDQRPGQFNQLHQLIAEQDGAAIDRDVGRLGRLASPWR